QANVVRVGSLPSELCHGPMTGKAAMAQPTHYVPAQHPPGHPQSRFSFRTDRLGVGRTPPFGTMGQFTDDMHRPIEGEQTAMTMIADGEPAPTCPAPPILDL